MSTNVDTSVKGLRSGLGLEAQEKAAILAPTIRELQEAGITSLGGIARALNDKSIPTPRGTGEWTATQVMRVLARLSFDI